MRTFEVDTRMSAESTKPERHCQELWTRNLAQVVADLFLASVLGASIVVVLLLSCSLPSMKVVPVRTKMSTSSAAVVLG